MSPQAQLEAYAQSIYLAIKNRYFDDISGEDGVDYVNQVIDNTNMYLDELENTPNADGNGLIDWWFTRAMDASLGTAAVNESTISLPRTADRLLTDTERYVQVRQDGTPVSNWRVVHPRNITNKADRVTEDMCALVGTNIVFSRPFRDYENGGAITGDVINKLNRLSKTNVSVLSVVRPKTLLILGVAKNSTLPDIVQGRLNPSYVARYDRLMTGAIARSEASSVSSPMRRQNFSGVRGVE